MENNLNNLPPFYVGQKVVCIMDFPRPHWFPAKLTLPKKGEIYTVRDIDNIGGWGILLKEISNKHVEIGTKNGLEFNFGCVGFRPLKEEKLSLVQLSKVLEKEKQLLCNN